MDRSPQGPVRVRYGRVGAAGSAFLVTLVALLGGIGVLPSGASAAATGRPAAADTAALSAVRTAPHRDAGSPAVQQRSDAATTLPDATGSGKRVVFDLSAQRVWLVDAGDDVVRTYLVSGSLTDNLHPGTYAVYSRSRRAVGIDDSGTMEFFVRFTRGANAAIGFHSIPTKDGHLVQTQDQLGTPQSHGCIRQARPDARRLWAFAPVGTKVVVTA